MKRIDDLIAIEFGTLTHYKEFLHKKIDETGTDAFGINSYKE